MCSHLVRAVSVACAVWAAAACCHVMMDSVKKLPLQDPRYRFLPTQGEAWPLPQRLITQHNYYTFNPTSFKIKVRGVYCPLLLRAAARYRALLGMDPDTSEETTTMDATTFDESTLNGTATDTTQESTTPGDLRGPAMDPRYQWQRGSAMDPRYPWQSNPGVRSQRPLRRRLTERRVFDPLHQGAAQSLTVTLSNSCEDYPHLNMDEAYKLSVSQVSTLQASSVWGALRGLETFTQLIYFIFKTNDTLVEEMRINVTSISDFPRYRHRGVLVDSARHYLPPPLLLRMLDALAANKMNVLHWHIVDDQSFPYVSNEYPKLSEGAFHPSLVYTAEDIAQIVEYARDRGVRVIPEFDVPGHTRSWGVGHPELLTECQGARYKHTGKLGPLHPVREEVYQLLRRLLAEVGDTFPDRYLHLGGDEVNLTCWTSNWHVFNYLSEIDAVPASELQALFLWRVLRQLGGRFSLIVWQDVYFKVKNLPTNITVQVWRTRDYDTIRKIVEAGHRVIVSSGWYLSNPHDGEEEMYDWDPRWAVTDPALAAGIIGGEAAMWGEQVDDINIMSRVWPLASTVAERLWSRAGLAWSVSARRRLEEHACRMTRRGFQVAPLGPGYCLPASF